MPTQLFTRLLAATILTLVAAPGFAQFTPTAQYQTLAEYDAASGTLTPPSWPYTDEVRKLGSVLVNTRLSTQMALDVTAGLLYIPESWSNASEGDIIVLDTATLSVRRRLRLQNGSLAGIPEAIAIDTAANRLFVGEVERPRVWVLDAVSGAVTEVIDVPHPVRRIVYRRSTSELYVIEDDPPYEQPGVYGLGVGVLALAKSATDPTRYISLVSGTAFPITWLGLNESSQMLYYVSRALYGVDMDPTSPDYRRTVFKSIDYTATTDQEQAVIDSLRNRVAFGNGLTSFFVYEGGRGSATFHQLLDQWNWSSGSLFNDIDLVTGRIYATTGDDSQLCALDIMGHGAWGCATAYAPNAGFGYAFVAFDPSSRRIFLLVGPPSSGEIGIYEDAHSSVEAVETSSVPVVATTPEATIQFAAVSAPGQVVVQPQPLSSVNAQLPGQFTIEGALAYEVSTSASVTGPFTLCFVVPAIADAPSFDALFVLHGENGQLVDRTVSRDFMSKTICAVTTTLSPFVIARRTTAIYSPRLLYTVDRSFKRGSTIPLKVQVLNGAGRNVSSPTLALKVVTVRFSSSETAVAVEDAGQANPDANFRYDQDLEGYIYNMSTKALAPGTYTVTADVGDRSRYVQIPFSVK